MAWSGSGTFTRVHDWTADRDSGIKILASRMDTEDDGFATGINACLAKNGENAATGNLNLGGNRFTNASTSVSARSDLTPVAVVQDGSVCFATASGTDTYTASPSPTLTAYANGQTFRIKFTNANTGAASLDINGVGAVDIKKHNDQALVAGDIEANSVHTLVYNSTGPKFDLHSPANNFPLPVEAGGTGATSLDALAKIASSNTFTADQTIQRNAAISSLVLDRSDTHGDNVLVGSLEFRGRDSGGANQAYAFIDARCVLDDAGSETGALEFRIGNAGSATQRLYLRNGLYTPNATGGDPGADKINAAGYQINGTAFGFPSVAVYENQQTSGTAGPSYTSGAWRTVTLNTEVVDADGIGSLSSNRVTLGAGTYKAVWSVAFVRGSNNSAVRTRLYNVTDTAVLGQSVNGTGLGSGVGGDEIAKTGVAYFTLAGSKALEVQLYCTVNSGTAAAVSTGDVEVYAQIIFEKIK